MDFYGFYTGKIFDAYQYLGAHVVEEGVVFRTFAPSASRITLIGEFNHWQRLWKQILLQRLYGMYTVSRKIPFRTRIFLPEICFWR